MKRSLLVSKIIKKWLTLNPDADADLVRYAKWQLGTASMNALKAELKMFDDFEPATVKFMLALGFFSDLREKQEMSATPRRPDPLPGTYYKLIGNSWCLCIIQVDGKHHPDFLDWEQKQLKALETAEKNKFKIGKNKAKVMPLEYYENLYAGPGYKHNWGLDIPQRSSFPLGTSGDEMYEMAYEQYLDDENSNIYREPAGYTRELKEYVEVDGLHDSHVEELQGQIKEVWESNFASRPEGQTDLRKQYGKYCPVWLAKARRDGTFKDWDMWKFTNTEKKIKWDYSRVEKHFQLIRTQKNGRLNKGNIWIEPGTGGKSYIDRKGRVLNVESVQTPIGGWDLESPEGIKAYIKAHPVSTVFYHQEIDRIKQCETRHAKKVLEGWAKEQKGCNMVSLTTSDGEYDAPGGDFVSADPSRILEELQQQTDYSLLKEGL